MLRDTRLQNIIRRIDTAEDRKRSLEYSMANDADFVSFIDKMMKTIYEQQI